MSDVMTKAPAKKRAAKKPAAKKKTARRRIIKPDWMFDPAAEMISKRALKELQLAKLQKTVRAAYNKVPHVRAKFDEAGVKPRHLKKLSDLRHFPFARKAELRENYPFGLFAVPREKIVRIHASSGTTGKPTVVGYTKKDLAVSANLMARHLAVAGSRPGDVMHNALGYGLFTGGLGFHDGSTAMEMTTVPVAAGNTERQLMLLQDFGANVLASTPSYALNIAEVAEANGIKLGTGPLRLAVCGAEPATDAIRQEIAKRLGALVIDSYGLSEVMGPGVTGECLEGHLDDKTPGGLHLWEDHFIFEIIDPKTEEPLPDGELGELVITTLSKEALPMVRYRTGDITRIFPEPCVCGRTHRRMARVTGRNDDMLIIRGVNLYPSLIEEALVGFPGVEPHYLLVVRRAGALDTLDVEIEAAAKVKKSGYPALAGKVGDHLKAKTGVACKVVVRGPGKLPRSEGKAVRVKDLRQK